MVEVHTSLFSPPFVPCPVEKYQFFPRKQAHTGLRSLPFGIGSPLWKLLFFLLLFLVLCECTPTAQIRYARPYLFPSPSILDYAVGGFRGTDCKLLRVLPRLLPFSHRLTTVTLVTGNHNILPHFPLGELVCFFRTKDSAIKPLVCSLSWFPYLVYDCSSPLGFTVSVSPPQSTTSAWLFLFPPPL